MYSIELLFFGLVYSKKMALIYYLTFFLISRLFKTLDSRAFSDPLLRSLCGIIEIQPLRGCRCNGQN